MKLLEGYSLIRHMSLLASSKNIHSSNGLRPPLPKGINYLPNIYCLPYNASQEIPEQLTQDVLSKGYLDKRVAFIVQLTPIKVR